MMNGMCLSITSEGEGLAAASAALDTKVDRYAINRSTAKAVRFYQQHQVLRNLKTALAVSLGSQHQVLCRLKTALAVARFIAFKPQSDF